jgi:hypothetical protein
VAGTQADQRIPARRWHRGLPVLVLRPGDAFLPLLIGAASAFEAAPAPEPAVAAVPVVQVEPGRWGRAAVVRERHEPGLDEPDIILQLVVVVHHVSDRLPGKHGRHLLPPVRCVPVDQRQRLLELLVLLRRPRVSSADAANVPVRPGPTRLPGEAGAQRRQQHLRPRLRHHLGHLSLGWLVAERTR